MAYLIAAIVMTLTVLEGHSPIEAFSSAIFRICHVVPLHLQSFLLYSAFVEFVTTLT